MCECCVIGDVRPGEALLMGHASRLYKLGLIIRQYQTSWN